MNAPQQHKSLIKSANSDIRDLFRLTKPYRMSLLIAAILMGISALSTAAYAYLVGPLLKTLFLSSSTPITVLESMSFISRLTHGFENLEPFYVGLAAVIVALIKALSFFGHSAVSAYVGQRLLHDLRLRLYDGLLRMNPIKAEAGDAGNWTVRFTLDVSQIEESVTRGIVAYFRCGIETLALAGLALSLDFRLGLLGLAAFPPIALLILNLGKRIRQRRKKANESAGSLGTAVAETSIGLATIKSFGAENKTKNRFKVISNDIYRSTLKASLLKAAGSPLNEILGAAALAGTLVWAANRIAQNDLAPETFISFFSALFLLYQPVKGLGQAHHSVEWGIAALSRIAPFLKDKSASYAPKPLRDAETVSIVNVETGYEQDIVLRNINLKIQPGERIAIIGASGSGKTTLLNLLLGLIPTRKGEILVGDKPYNSNDAVLFAPVRQEPFLFDDTIAENIKIGAAHSSLDDLESACRAAGLWDFICSAERGLNTSVGPFGHKLSVGQRQRVCLARALISKAPILLLDEVTASVDGETEMSIIDGLREQKTNRTIIVVTHRLSTAQWADRVIFLENGTVEADGPTELLLSENPKIAVLFGKAK